MNSASMSNILRTDFVRIVKNMNLQKALQYIEEMQSTVNRVPVTVFKSVLSHNDSIDITAHLKDNKIVVLKEKVYVVKTDIHEVCLQSKNNQNLQDLIKMSEEGSEFLKRYPHESDNDYGLRIFDTFFSQSRDGEFTSLYGRDSLVAPNGQTKLKFFKSTINENGTEDVKGVTSPMWYISGPGSATVFHNEDGDLPSINLSLSGKSKVYAFIPQQFSKELAKKINPDVECELFHKPGLIISPNLLRQWNIPIQFYVQEAGDLIYISECVLHAVINNGVTIAEAINYGTPASIARSSVTICNCENRGRLTVEEILKRPIEKKKLVHSKKKSYRCVVDGCISGSHIYTCKQLTEHNVKIHNVKPVVCKNETCGKTFMRKENMILHYNQMHGEVNFQTKDKKTEPHIICEFCDKLITKSNLNRHVTEMHIDNKQVNCEKCGLRLLKRTLVKHLEKCNGKPECHCGRKFASTRYLLQHQKKHKEN